MAEKIYNPKTGKLEWPIGSKERAAEMTAEAYKKAGFTPKPVEPAPLTDIQKQTLAHREGVKELGKDVSTSIGQTLFQKGSPGYNALVFDGTKPTASTKTPTPGISLSPDHPLAEKYPTMGIGNIQKVSSPTGQSTITKAPKAAASPVTQTATGIGEGMTPANAYEAPPIATAAPEKTWKDKLSGIGEGLGKWASDPKIARALTMAGLTTLATEPRRVPYSNAEMLGRAGLAGIGAYDQAAAGEAAGREATRKALLEERKMKVDERLDAYTESEPSFDQETGKVVRYVTDKGTGDVIGKREVSKQELAKAQAETAKMRREAAGSSGADQRSRFAEEAYQIILRQTGDREAAKLGYSDAQKAFDAIGRGEEFVPGMPPEVFGRFKSLFFTPGEGTPGRWQAPGGAGLGKKANFD